MVSRLDRLRDFVSDFAGLLDRTDDETVILKEGSASLAALLENDDWLPNSCAVPDPHRYQQYLLHCDSAERFSVVSFVWGPGQSTPIHNHTVWGLVGVLRGAEITQGFTRDADGLHENGRAHRLQAGDVEAISPGACDVHRVTNGYSDRASVSIHVYGANIGAVKRSTFQLDGQEKPFISGYANKTLPNLWDRSAHPA